MNDGRKPFEPLNGTPRWKKLYDYVTTKLNTGDELTYRDAGDLVNLDHRDRDQLALIQASMRDANIRLMRDGLPPMKTVAKFGWIVPDPTRELELTDGQVDKTRRAAGRGVLRASSLNNRRSELTSFERDRLDWAKRAARMGQMATRRSRKSPDELRKMLEGPDPED